MSLSSLLVINDAERVATLGRFFSSLDGEITAETISLGFEAMCLASKQPFRETQKEKREESKKLKSVPRVLKKKSTKVQVNPDPLHVYTLSISEKAKENGISFDKQLQKDNKLSDLVMAMDRIINAKRAKLDDPEYNDLSRQLVVTALLHSTRYTKRVTAILHSRVELFCALNLTQLKLQQEVLQSAPKLTPNLRVLHCSKIDDKGLATIAKITTLEVLKITESTISEAGFRMLPLLTNITSLSIEGANQRLANRALQVLVHLPKLQVIEIPGCSVTNKGANTLLQMPQLRRVILRDSMVHNSARERIIQEHPSLEVFDSFEQKKETDVEFAQFLDSTSKDIRAFKECAAQKLTDNSIKRLCETLPNLREVTLHGCHQFTDSALLYFASLKHLQSVQMYSCRQITASGVLQASKASRAVFDIQKGMCKTSQVKQVVVLRD